MMSFPIHHLGVREHLPKPDHAEAHARLGQALAKQGRWEEAEAACREAVRLSSDDSRFRNALSAVLRRRL